MKSRLMTAAVLSAAVLLGQNLPRKSNSPPGKQLTIEGLVRDIACPIQNKESTATRFNLQCAIQCAKLGSPLVILTDDGTMYIPISNSMPDEDQRPRLLPFAGKYVTAQGVVYERAGTKAIVISDIHEDKNKTLTRDAFQPQ
jgi:hypothetical protein